MSNEMIQYKLRVFIEEVITPRGDKPLDKEVWEHLGEVIEALEPTDSFLAKPKELLVA